ncbi:MAG: DUF3592 domain-containing protein [Anaerolineales bacterium]|nr:DUF3592 domain-containing protein [Anaerolineales bacterium]
MPKNRRDWIILSSVPLLFAAMLWGIIAIQQSEIQEFRSEGIPANANVVDSVKKSERSSSTDTNSIVYELTVTYMDRSDVVEEGVSVDLQSGEFDFGTIDIGEFRRAKFNINKSSYDTISVGDEVEILYLPDKPAEAMLAEEVANWRPIFLQVLIGILVAATLYCFVRAIFAPPAAPKPPSEFPEWEGAA